MSVGTLDLRAGGTTRSGASQTEPLLRVAYAVLENCGAQMSHSKVVRIVRRFEDSNAGHGLSFFYYLAAMVRLDAEEQRALLANPDVARVIAYADPTGETAVANVMRAR